MKRRTVALIALCFAYLETAFELKREEINQLVDEERDRQDAYWGGYDHDQTHDGRDWALLFVKQIGKLATEFVP